MSLDHLPPRNVEAEQAVLGSILIDPEALATLSPYLEAEDFYRHQHQRIYRAMVALDAKGGPVDVITLADELERCGDLEDIGGTSAVTALANAVPHSGNVLSYAHIVRRAAVLRGLLHAAGKIAQIAGADGAEGDPLNEADDAVDEAERIIFALRQGRLGRGQETARRFTAEADALIERLERFRERPAGALRGLPTGFRRLDGLLGGLRPGDLVLLAARPSVGKSALALALTRTAARAGWPVLLFSLEMSTEQVTERLVAMESGVPLTYVRDGCRDEGDDWERVIGARAEMDDLHILIDDTGAISLADVRSRVRRAVAEHNVGLIVVDYLQLMTSSRAVATGHRRDDTREQEVARIARGLKQLAREVNVPILALAQLSRAVEGRRDKRPMLSDLRESGSLEAEADVVMLLSRDEIYDPTTERKGLADVIVAKHRQGACGETTLYYDAPRVTFRDLAVARGDAGDARDTKRPTPADVGPRWGTRGPKEPWDDDDA